MKVAEEQPVITSATIVTLITAIIALLIAFGVPITDEQKIAAIGVVSVLAPLAVIWWPQLKTTPLAKPMDEDGTELVRKYSGEPTLSAAREEVKKR